MLIKDVLHWAHEYLLLSSDSARLDAEILLSHVLKKPVTFLLAHDESEIGFFKLQKYRHLISRRKEGVPVAYLTGHRDFYGLDFEVNKHILVPRPDTEVLVEGVIEYINKITNTAGSMVAPGVSRSDNRAFLTPDKAMEPALRDYVLLDVGTGSACIPISVLKNVPDITAVATEISGSAMKVAKRNIAKHKLKSRIELFKSDLLQNVPVGLLRDKEIVLTANLPYIPKRFAVHPSTRFEPDVALYGGADGLDIYKRLVEQLEKMEIKPKAIFFELFEHQIAILCQNMPDYELRYAKNMTGEARCLMMELK